MLSIISSTTGPIRFIKDPSCVIHIGSVVELIEINGNPVVTLSNGDRPLGVVMENGLPYDMVLVACDTMLFVTDNYEKRDCNYSRGTKLYVRKGKISSLPPKEDAIWVGECLAGPSEDDCIEVHWI